VARKRDRSDARRSRSGNPVPIAGIARDFREIKPLRPSLPAMDTAATFDQTASAATSLRTLVPFTAEECISIGEAAAIARKSERTIRNWAVLHGIGRRVAGGAWGVSKVALAMLLDGDLEALAAYRDDGARGSWPPVAKYYERCGLADLLERPGFAA